MPAGNFFCRCSKYDRLIINYINCECFVYSVGLLGATINENQRMRLLLKVLAISDIAIYRTRAERLHSDLFTFLGTASKAFYKHFSTALQSFGLPGPATSLGPAIIIFHETRNTQTIKSCKLLLTTHLIGLPTFANTGFLVFH